MLQKGERKLDKDETIELGRILARLMERKDFENGILEGFIVDKRNVLTKNFTGSIDEVEGLKAIAYFESWLHQSLEDAKILLKES